MRSVREDGRPRRRRRRAAEGPARGAGTTSTSWFPSTSRPPSGSGGGSPGRSRPSHPSTSRSWAGPTASASCAGRSREARSPSISSPTTPSSTGPRPLRAERARRRRRPLALHPLRQGRHRGDEADGRPSAGPPHARLAPRASPTMLGAWSCWRDRWFDDVASVLTIHNVALPGDLRARAVPRPRPPAGDLDRRARRARRRGQPAQGGDRRGRHDHDGLADLRVGDPHARGGRRPRRRSPDTERPARRHPQRHRPAASGTPRPTRTSPLATTASTTSRGKPDCRHELCRLADFEPADPAMIVGSVGRLRDQKGFDLLLEAAPELIRRGVRIVLLGLGRAALEHVDSPARGALPAAGPRPSSASATSWLAQDRGRSRRPRHAVPLRAVRPDADVLARLRHASPSSGGPAGWPTRSSASTARTSTAARASTSTTPRPTRSPPRSCTAQNALLPPRRLVAAREERHEGRLLLGPLGQRLRARLPARAGGAAGCPGEARGGAAPAMSHLSHRPGIVRSETLLPASRRGAGRSFR